MLLPRERISFANTAKLLNGRFASCSRLAASRKPSLPHTTPRAAVPKLGITGAWHCEPARWCPLPENMREPCPSTAQLLSFSFLTGGTGFTPVQTTPLAFQAGPL